MANNHEFSRVFSQETGVLTLANRTQLMNTFIREVAFSIALSM